MTEAEELLRAGRLYTRRAGWTGPDGAVRLLFAGVKRGAFSLYLDDDPHLHFDLDGRWQRVYRGGSHYRRALDGTVEALDLRRDGGLSVHRYQVRESFVRELDAWVGETAAAVRGEIRTGLRQQVTPPGGGTPLDVAELDSLLGRVEGWDAPAWAELARQYRDAYAPIGFVPPAAPAPLVVQATLGQRHARVFGGGGGEALRVRSVEGFRDHLAELRSVLGRRIAQFRSVYLAGPDVAGQETAQVMGWLEAIRGAADAGRPPAEGDEAPSLPGRVELFVEPGRGPVPDVASWRAYRELGVRRVTIGLTVSDDGLTEAAGAVVETARVCREAGVATELALAAVTECWCAPTHGTAELDRAPWSPGDRITLVQAPGATISGDEPWLTALQARHGLKVVSYEVRRQWTV